MTQLQIEGNEAGAKYVMEVDMPQAGLEPDDTTREIMRYSTTVSGKLQLEKLRSAKVRKYLKKYILKKLFTTCRDILAYLCTVLTTYFFY